MVDLAVNSVSANVELLESLSIFTANEAGYRFYRGWVYKCAIGLDGDATWDSNVGASARRRGWVSKQVDGAVCDTYKRDLEVLGSTIR